jgi:hypothetical protein
MARLAKPMFVVVVLVLVTAVELAVAAPDAETSRPAVISPARCTRVAPVELRRAED